MADGDSVHDPATASWHLDKRLPIALIITVLLGFSGNLWATITWVNKTDSRVANLELANADRIKDFDKAELQRDRQEDKLGQISALIATLNAKQDATQDNVKELKGSVDILIQRVLNSKPDP